MKEIYPIMNNLLIEIYYENPYKKEVKDNEVVMTDDFVNPDSGMIDKLENNIFIGHVIEVGSDCKYVKVGDDVIFDYRVLSPTPFMGHELWMLNEQSVKAVIADNLKERFEK